jgi:hypothetical protein
MGQGRGTPCDYVKTKNMEGHALTTERTRAQLKLNKTRCKECSWQKIFLAAFFMTSSTDSPRSGAILLVIWIDRDET